MNMFCSNCGNQLENGTKFCCNCGSPTATATTPTAETSFVAPPIATAPVMSAPQAVSTAPAVIRFCPKKVFGQYMVSKATIEVGAKNEIAKFGKEISFQLEPGAYRVFCYMNYLGKSGKAEATFTAQGGKTYFISYKSPAVVMASGKIEISEIS